jgi:predicted RNase H-like HicB family nuclease
MKKVRATKKQTLPVLIEQDEDGIYVGTVPSLRSCYTQGKTLDELYTNLQEAVSLCLEVEKDYFKTTPQASRIVGFQNLEFSVS